MAAEEFPMTPQGYEALKAELQHIREVERPENVQEIETALEHGDLRENAEYHAAKERQGKLDGRMRYLEHRIARAKVIDPLEMDTEKVGFAATVTLLDVETDEEVVYALVGEDESDVDAGKISITSPLARAMVGREEGDEIVAKLPKGPREFEVVSVNYKAIG